MYARYPRWFEYLSDILISSCFYNIKIFMKIFIFTTGVVENVALDKPSTMSTPRIGTRALTNGVDGLSLYLDHNSCVSTASSATEQWYADSVNFLSNFNIL